MLAPVRTEAPSDTPVSFNEVKAHCRVDDNSSDAVLTVLLNAAVDHLDGWSGILGRCIVTQTWRQDFAAFACLRLPLGPVASVSEVKYFDADGVQQTLSTDVYQLLTDARGPYLDLKPGQSWPGTYSRPDAVSVTFVAGMAAAAVPGAIKAAILLLVSHWNENREAVAEGAMFEVPLGVSALIAPHRRVNV
ncbi:head-tail connector protein [Mesorhizobium marinum]|uniref:head-tail connector protein n=1 Tax=Mesorhizobium marinum TaxID=3228790 RepID=UPI003467325D